jgi:hypothetical protein
MVFAVSLLASKAILNDIPPLPDNAPNTTISTMGKNKLKNTACGLLKMEIKAALVIASMALSWL